MRPRRRLSVRSAPELSNTPKLDTKIAGDCAIELEPPPNANTL